MGSERDRAVVEQAEVSTADWTQQQIADEVGVSQPYVSQVISKNLESKELVIPEHLTATDSKAGFRKSPPASRS